MPVDFEFFIAKYPLFSPVIGLLLAFGVTWIGIPSVIRIAKIKSLYDFPIERSSHEYPVPRLGGTMIFAGVILSSVLFTSLSTATELKYIIAGMLVLFFIGVKDDIVSLVPFKKAIGQLIATSIIIFAGNIRIESCYGFFGHTELPWLASVALTAIVIMTLINSINLIDGIDGLASGIGIIASVVFGILFFINEQVSYATICFSLAGALMSFFYFNVLSTKNKIFLGDTGSMLIGFLLSIFIIYLIELDSPFSPSIKAYAKAPALACAIVFVPVFDTLRISILRLIRGKAIYEADHNHIHHILLKITGSHLKSTLIILSLNLALIILVFLLKNVGNKLLILLLIGIGIIYSVLIELLGKKCDVKT